MTTRPTFQHALMAFLFDAPNTWHARRTIARCVGTGSVTQRISDLRRLGLQIECRDEFKTVRGRVVRLTFYRYVPPKAMKTSAA